MPLRPAAPAQTPVLSAAAEARQIEQQDALAIGFDQCEQAAHAQGQALPLVQVVIPSPALCLDIQYLNTRCVEDVQQAPASSYALAI